MNRYPTSEWLLLLKMSVAGSKLESSLTSCSSFEEAKEILLTHGTTVEEARKDSKNKPQRSDESFCQFVVPVYLVIKEWSELAAVEEFKLKFAYHVGP